MAGINFKRIFHPVGHGTFFTEQFVYEDDNVPFFNVVYDCGSLSKARIKREVTHQCKYRGMTHVDLLFISHFDYDHISGLSFLRDKKLINDNTYTFIPYYYSLFHQLIGAENTSYIEGINEMFRVLSRANVKIVLVTESTDMVKYDDIIFDDLSKLGKPDVVPYELENHNGLYVINNGTRIVIRDNQDNPIWYYIPFNYGEDPTKEVVKNLSSMGLLGKNNKLDSERLIDILSRRGKDDYKQQLRKMYRKIAEGNLNANSLQLLSYRDYTRIKLYCIREMDTLYESFGLPSNRNKDCFCCSKRTCSCLYTGDTDLRGDDKIAFIRNIKSTCLSDELMMIQIPHHGSIHNYNPTLTELANVAFVNFKPHTKICSFNEGLFEDFMEVNKPIIPVSDSEIVIHCGFW